MNHSLVFCLKRGGGPRIGMPSSVVLQKGNDRYQNVRQALERIRKEIKKKIEKKKPKNIIIKPNFVSCYVPLCATHVEAIRAVLDFFLANRIMRPIIIAEGSAVGETFEGFKNYGYFEKLKGYEVEFKDLNQDESIEVEILNKKLRTLKIKVAKTLTSKENFLISVTPMKTHDSLIVTLSIKNLLMAAPQIRGFHNFKSQMHQGYPATNLNLVRLSKFIYPDLSIIDAFLAMEGNGPTDGNPVKMKLALASTDPLAADTVATYLMGFKPSEVGYLYYLNELKLGCGDLGKIKILGNTNLKENQRSFKPHSTYKRQKKWQKESWSELI